MAKKKRINVRSKGQSGEREVAKILNAIIAKVREMHNLPAFEPQDELVQRNQNQSAVGGSDLSSPFPLSIEVKRQEQLSINTWWKQCTDSAARTDEIPILMYKQNWRQWHIMMDGAIGNDEGVMVLECVVTTDLDSFEEWFAAYYESYLLQAGLI